jgi:hypothetical protein
VKETRKNLKIALVAAYGGEEMVSISSILKGPEAAVYKEEVMNALRAP